MKIKVTLSFCLMLMTVVVFGQDQECFSGMTKKLMDWVRQDFESPQEAQKAKVGIVEGLIGCDMPEFEAMTLDSMVVNPETLKGSITVINFWFIGCPPCEIELPGLNKLVDEFEEKGVVFLAFGRDIEEDVIEYLEENTFKYQQIPQSSAPGVFSAFQVRFGYPYHLIFDEAGKLVFVTVGGSIQDENYMYNSLKPVLDDLLKL
jgi:thiol-disulfide isomerase/thioredoxin